MNRPPDLFPERDFCSTAIFLLALLWIGGKAVEQRPTLRRRGKNLATLAFFGFGLFEWLGTNPSGFDAWITVLVRALFVALITLPIAWLGLVLLAFLYRLTITVPLAKLRSLRHAARRRKMQRRDQRHSDERQASNREQSRHQSEAQRRRTDARAAVALSYSLVAPKLGARFSQQMFDDYVAKFMGDEHPPEDVERRGQELLSLFEKHVAELQRPQSSTTIESLTNWYEEQKARIEALPAEEKIKRIYLSNLNERYAQLMDKLMETMEP